MKSYSLSLAVACSLLFGCGPSTPPADAPAVGASAAARAGAAGAADDIPITVEKSGPPDLSDSEKKEVSATCAPLQGPMIEGEALAVRALDEGLREDPKTAEDKAVAVALERVKKSAEGLSPGDFARCVALYEKQQRNKLFGHEPAEDEARMVVDSCIKRVEAVYGKNTMAFDMGGDARPVSGPFCPDDFPVPQKLKQLPYQSSKEDWDVPTWRCLQFGLRVKQRVQVEYSAPLGSAEFTCIARYVPRQGGAPVEIFRGGRQGPDGRLMLQPKTMKRKMKKP
jgi:hypothetical protein